MKNENEIALNIIELYGVAKKKGIMAIKDLNIENDELRFMFDIMFECVQKGINNQQIYEILNNYDKDFDNKTSHKLIVNGFMCILAGENIEYLIELEASILRRAYRLEFMKEAEKIIEKENIKTKILNKYISKKPYSDNTDLIDRVINESEDDIKNALKKMTNIEIKCIIAGVSGDKAVRILSVLDNELVFLDEDLVENINEADIINAENKFLDQFKDI